MGVSVAVPTPNNHYDSCRGSQVQVITFVYDDQKRYLRSNSCTMVEDRITDGKRIGQFLASELTGLEAGPLSHVEVRDADPDAEPTREGSHAYRIAYRDEPLASAVLFPDAVEIRLEDGRSWNRADSATDIGIDGLTLRVESVAAVKGAVDSLEETLDSSTDR
jgi:hypothetical protein